VNQSYREKTMTSLHGAEIAWIITLQNTADLERPLGILLHVAYSPLAFLGPVIYLCISRRLGGMLCLLMALNSCLVWILKCGMHLPRPYWLNAEVETAGKAYGYGMPSGHVQSAACLWLYLARAVRNRWAWAAALLLISVVAFSRVYAGLHFISDVAGGFLFGCALLSVFLWASVRHGRRLGELSFARQIAICVAAIWILAAIAALAASFCPSLEAELAIPSWRVDLRHLAQFAAPAGRLFGTAAALAAANRWAQFEVRGPLWQRLLRCAFLFGGIELSSALWGLLPVPEWQWLKTCFLFLKSAWIPLWVLFIAPAILLGAGMLASSQCAEDSRTGESAGHQRRLPVTSSIKNRMQC
jgi:membrane-associated phospholipid phosphatase